ncbi:MAG TPA: PTS sugar transporter subunit IIA, partial [Thermoanaerobaculia bacterium]|nr:PTS sugar transporter subunit IIA [Thermoanaerobaculia bacterium]
AGRRRRGCAMPVAGPLTRPELIFSDLPATDRRGVLRELAERVAATGLVRDADVLFRALLEREQLGSTGIGHGVAIPHCKLQGLEQGILAVGIARPPVDFGAADGAPVAMFFLVLSPDDSPAEHLQTLARISRWVRADRHVETLLGLEDRGAIYDFLKESV